MSLVTTLVTTGMLAYKIYKVDREVTGYRLSPSILRTIIRIIIESGIIYAVALVLSIVLTAISAPYQKIAVDSVRNRLSSASSR